MEVGGEILLVPCTSSPCTPARRALPSDPPEARDESKLLSNEVEAGEGIGKGRLSEEVGEERIRCLVGEREGGR